LLKPEHWKKYQVTAVEFAFPSYLCSLLSMLLVINVYLSELILWNMSPLSFVIVFQDSALPA
jgi:hypothetical protein